MVKKWGKGNPLWEWQHRQGKGSRKTKRTGGRMVKKYRSRGRRGGGFSMGSIAKAMLGGIAGGFVAGALGFDKRIGGAAGGYLLGGKTITSAAIGAGEEHFVNGSSLILQAVGGLKTAVGSGTVSAY